MYIAYVTLLVISLVPLVSPAIAQKKRTPTASNAPVVKPTPTEQPVKLIFPEKRVFKHDAKIEATYYKFQGGTAVNLSLMPLGTTQAGNKMGSDEVKTVTADDAAAVLTVQDTSYRDGD
jgi:hypothetical protein